MGLSRTPKSNHTQDRIEEDGSPQNEYPHQKVWQTQGGIKFVYGDEAGKQFLRMIHPSGTYYEIYPDGKVTHMSVGDSKSYHKGGFTMTMDENGDIKMNGHGKIVLEGGPHIEVAGDAGIMVGGNLALGGLGNMKIDVKDVYLGVRGNLGMKIEGSTRISTVGNLTIDTAGKSEMITGETALLQSGEKMTLENPSTLVQSPDINLGGEGGQLLHRKGDVDSDGDAAVGSAATVKAV